MIKNRELWKEWENEFRNREAADFFENLHLLESMYQEAQSMGIFPLRDPWEGLDLKIKIAKTINVSAAPRKNRTQP